MAEGDVFKIGDTVEVDVVADQGTAFKRRGVVTALPVARHMRHMHAECYRVRFPSGSATYLTVREIDHIDVVSRLGDLA